MQDISRELVEAVTRGWVDSWADPDAAAFAANYIDTGEYVDHAFQLRRVGREAIARHHSRWLSAVPDFEMRPGEFNVVGRKSLFSYVGTGTFENDLPILAATGTTFTFRGFVVLTVDERGLIERTEEFYTTSFHGGVPFEDYNFQGIESHLVS